MYPTIEYISDLSTTIGYKMDFKTATDKLMVGITREQIAEALGKGLDTVRQARLDASANAYRTPPKGWEGPLAALAEKEGNRLLSLSKALDKAAGKSLKS
jgi:hypothetical protein